VNGTYGDFYQELQDALGTLRDNIEYDDMTRLVSAGRATVSLNRKLMEKSIDVSWVEAIEDGMLHLDNVVRNPSRTIVDVEEIVPIALSRKTTVESVKHLAQHTDLIQSIDKKRGTITPSKILNVHKEESLATYENRFINTLIDRLYIFIMKRYEKLSEVEKDEEVYAMEYTDEVDDKNGNLLTVKLSIDTTRSLEATNDSGYTIWQRVEKLKKTLEGYKGSELCTTLGNNFVRPPIMRTNAIMKNVDMRACLTLWQYILSYDKVGYEINVEDTSIRPEQAYLGDLENLMAANLLLFRSYTNDGGTVTYKPLEKKKYKATAPKVIKRYNAELLSGHYDLHADESVGYVVSEGMEEFVKTLPEDSDDIFEAINAAIEIERNYYNEKERVRQEELAEEERKEKERQERQARLDEKKRIEEARREERERIRLEKEAEEKRVQEMLERRRQEIEAERQERERLQAEREAKRAEERRIAEEAEREAEEREKHEADKQAIRSNFGAAEGINTEVFDRKKESRDRKTAFSTVTAEDMEAAAAAIEEKAQAVQDAQQAHEEAVEAIDEARAARAEAMEAEAEARAAGNEEAIRLAQEEVERAKENVKKAKEEAEIAREKAEEADKQQKEESEAYEDPRQVAARMKLEQQKREKENREKERAARLRADRKAHEELPFHEIYKRYTKNPIYAIPRFFRWLLFVLFGIIPKDTDSPTQKKILAERAAKAQRLEYEKSEREKFQIYYNKYATNYPYNIKRFIADQKFKKKKKKEAASKPKPVFNPPQRTPEEQRAIDMEMRRLYKEYHVSLAEAFRRWIKKHRQSNEEEQKAA